MTRREMAEQSLLHCPIPLVETARAILPPEPAARAHAHWGAAARSIRQGRASRITQGPCCRQRELRERGGEFGGPLPAIWTAPES
jgi:hypothetical protein